MCAERLQTIWHFRPESDNATRWRRTGWTVVRSHATVWTGSTCKRCRRRIPLGLFSTSLGCPPSCSWRAFYVYRYTTEIIGKCTCYTTEQIAKTHLNGFLDGDLCTMVRPMAGSVVVVVESMDLTNRDWRARCFIFILCIFITSSGRFHFGGVQPLSNSSMPMSRWRTAARRYYNTEYNKRRVQRKPYNGQLHFVCSYQIVITRRSLVSYHIIYSGKYANTKIPILIKLLLFGSYRFSVRKLYPIWISQII